MEFFNRIKTKLKIKNLLNAILFLVVGVVMILLAISNGFSSDLGWQYGIRGSGEGIPIPNWIISCMFIIVSVIFVLSAFRSLKSFVKNTEYNKMLDAVQVIGDVDNIGRILSSMSKSEYPKGGELKYNHEIVFYMKGTDVTVIAPRNVRNIRAEIVKRKYGEENYVCIYHGIDVLKIEVSKRKVLLLLDDMRKVLGTR